ncbi:MAG: CHAT domain-containing protein [Lewinellaceae bacterium]|nr:CHAT domain-containing protein [Lewinellaceae bacterium]
MPAPSKETCSEIDSLQDKSEYLFGKKQYADADSIAEIVTESVRANDCNWATWVRARILKTKIIRNSDEENGVRRALDSLKADVALMEDQHTEIAGLLHLQIAFLYNRFNRDYLNALLHYEKARRSHENGFKAAGRYSGQFLYKPLANMYTRLGESDKAVNLLQIARDSSIVQGDTAAIPEIYCDLGRALMDVGNLAPACSNYDTGLQYSLKNPGGSPQRITEVRTLLLSNWAEAMWRAGDPDSARALANRSLEYDPENPEALQTLGEVELKAGNTQQADGFFQRSEDIRRSYGYPLDRELAKVLLRRAQLAAGQNPSGAGTLGLCNEALRYVIPTFRPAGVFDNPDPASFYPENTILEALDLKSEILWQQYEQNNHPAELLRLADTTIALALRSADVLTSTYGFESSVLNSQEYTRALHERYFRILFERNEQLQEPETPARIVDFSERSRALLLRQKLADDATLNTSGIPGELLEREKLLRAKLTKQRNTLAEMEADGEPTEMIEQQKRQIFILEDERGVLNKEIRSFSGAYTGGDSTRIVSLSGIRAQLGGDDAMLVAYFYNPATGALYQVGITRREVRLARHTLSAANIEAFIAAVRNDEEAAKRTDVDPEYLARFVRESTLLYDSLLAPVAAGFPLRELIIVPDGILGAFPFDLLLKGPTQGLDSFNQLPYLFRDVAVRFAPSATVLMQGNQRTGRNPREGYFGIAPAYKSKTFPWVEFGSDCVAALRDLFSGQLLTGFAATKERFRERAGDCQILHFYGHGRADNVTPGRSYLAFTSSTGDSTRKSTVLAAASQLPAEEVPNLLFAQEISLMRLNADLVVLSACETGVGKVVGGEGVLSLARAFLDAGCPSAAMTLWTVDDEATDQLTQSFFRHIREGKRKDIALQLAKKEFLKTGKSAAPYYWSGFVLTGDASPLQAVPEGCYFSIQGRTYSCGMVWSTLVLLGGILILLAIIFRYVPGQN